MAVALARTHREALTSVVYNSLSCLVVVADTSEPERESVSPSLSPWVLWCVESSHPAGRLLALFVLSEDESVGGVGGAGV